METEKKKPVMFLGRYRTGLNPEEAKLYDRVARMLFRCGKQGEGTLSNRVQQNLGSESWNKCMETLAAWGIVEFEPGRTGRARVVALTESGKGAVQFCDEPQDETEGTLAK